MLEKLWSCERPELDDEEWIEFLWDRSIDRIRNDVVTHPLNRRFSNAENWPGYHLTHAMARIRALEALAGRPRSREATPPAGATGGPAREQTFYAMDGKLKGQPDVVVGDELRDYKSGSVFEESPDGSKTVKEGYVRQLRLYGHLVKENSGVCPSKGKLLPMQGNPVEIDLVPEECEAEAREAIDLLDSLNSAISGNNSVDRLASASEESCYWCSHKTHCEVFWSNVSEGWWDDGYSAAISGRLLEPPLEIHAGKSIALKIDILAGNIALGECVIGPFDKDIHTSVDSFSIGDDVRIVGCYRKQDGTLTTTQWTVCFGESEWPEILTTMSNST